jgi:hypothetical protein
MTATTTTTAQIRQALATAIKAGIGTSWQVSPYMLALPTPPAVDVRPGLVSFDAAMAQGGDNLTFMVRGMVAWAADQATQARLDALRDRGPTSIKALVETDPSLGGLVADLYVSEVGPYLQMIVEGQPPLLATEWTVEVLGL